MVAASQPLAVAAGLEILAAGGNAADAAVATAAALNVTEPTSTGLGGDCFALFYEAATGQVTALNGSGRAPAALTLERLRARGVRQRSCPPYHPYTITVPGACAGWCDLVARHGRLPLAAILAPAIRLAEEGFPVAPITSYFWQRGAERQLRARARRAGADARRARRRGPARSSATPAWRAPCAPWPRAARTRSTEGEIAEAIAADGPGGRRLHDGRPTWPRTRSTWDEPISTTYRGAARAGNARRTGRGWPRCWRSTSWKASTWPALDPLSRGALAPGDRGHAPGLRRHPLVRGRPGLQPVRRSTRCSPRRTPPSAAS